MIWRWYGDGDGVSEMNRRMRMRPEETIRDRFKAGDDK
jgi:hypothetical protein